MHFPAIPSRRLIFGAIPVVALFLFFTGASPAHALGWGDLNPLGWGDQIAGFFAAPATGAVQIVVGVIKLAVWWLTRGIVGLFTFVVYSFSQEVGFFGNEFVQVGWAVVRDITNWFFIVFLLVSAIATILDIENYNARKILPKLIIVALLVNFSLFFTGFAINVAQGITSIFVTQLAGQYDDIGQAFLNGLQITNASMADLNAFDDFIHKLSDNVQSIAEDIVAIILLLFVAYVFAFMALSLLYRIVQLWILMILSPLAFLAAILPATQQYWNKWLHDFTRWTVFAPIAVFFIWLGTWLIFYLNSNQARWGEYETNSGFVLAILGGADKMMRYAVILIFLYMSVKVTQALAGEAAKFATATIGAAIGGVALGAAGGGAAIGLLRASRMGAAAQGAIGRAVANTPILRRIPGAETIVRGGIEAEERRYARRGEAAREVEGKSPENKLALYKSTTDINKQRGIAESLAKQGKLDLIEKDKQLGGAEIQKLMAEEKKRGDSWTIRSAAWHKIQDPDERNTARRRMTEETAESNAKEILTATVPDKTGKPASAMTEFIQTGTGKQFEGLWRGAMKTEETFEQLQQAIKGNAEALNRNSALRGYLTSTAGRPLGIEVPPAPGPGPRAGAGGGRSPAGATPGGSIGGPLGAERGTDIEWEATRRAALEEERRRGEIFGSP
ncbi:MAG: type IV secretion system protein [Candidatus Terrybacteria bacterium]|nr:type IV secretion system protein [Candidatus Terrybacteria bacterium]